jgi:MFS family permease
MERAVDISRAAKPKKKFAEMRDFFILWSGQLVSTIGSGMTAFALGLFVYQRTNSATDFALIFLSGMLPRALFSPFAGVLADRIDRRKLMAISDLGAMTGIAAVIPLAVGDHLEVWQIYLVTAVGAAFSALRVPAYTAAAGSMVSKEQYGRVGGMIQLSDAVGQVVAPVAAGILVSMFAITSVLWIDLLTFLISLATLFLVSFSHRTDAGQNRGSFLADIRIGWDYLAERPGLVRLLLVFVIGNFFVGNAQALLTPMILGFSSPQTLGVILSAGGASMLLGGIILSAWGGGKHRIHTILSFYFLLGLSIMLAGTFPAAKIVGAAIFMAYLSLPFIIGTTNAVLISKVAPQVQGRIFSLRIMLVTLSFTLAFTTAGPLADRIFEPLLASNGALAGSVGRLIGTGDGRGIGLMFILLGFFAMLTAISGFMFPRLRHLEEEVPDIE